LKLNIGLIFLLYAKSLVITLIAPNVSSMLIDSDWA